MRGWRFFVFYRDAPLAVLLGCLLALREFGIRDVRYADYRIALVGETAIRFLSNLAQESIVSYPKFT